MTLSQEIIAAKRDGKALSADDLRQVATGLTDGSLGDAQAGAFAMAVLLNGMNEAERVAWTLAMRDSGTVFDWDLPGPVVDKHSTGGIGDTVSLILAPALAACGQYVPMISGRGLGHTGGTLDKLEAIPGYRVQPTNEEFETIIRQIGCAIIGQTADLAPADKRLYAIRDVTATVESIDLIAASILSKKLAAGLDRLVLDVKCGTGAFMGTEQEAKSLAEALVSVATGAGCPTTALITDMNEPLGAAAGNALEVANAIKLMRGDEVDARLWDVTVSLGGALIGDGGDKVAEAISSGAALERFGAMVTALGGPADLTDRPESYLSEAHVIEEVTPTSEGFVTGIDTRALGMAVVELGGGRMQPTDKVNPAVGFDWLLGIGLLADRETPLARVHAANTEDAARAAEQVRAAYRIGPSPPPETELVKDIIR